MTEIVLECVQNGAGTADVMAERANVSVRTIYRHIKAMQSYGVKIEGAAGFGYVLRDGKGKKNGV